MLVQALDEVSEAQITVISESQSSNSLMTPREQMTSSKSHFKALSTGISDIGAASMVFTVESSEISTQSEVRGIEISSKKSQRSELVPVRLYPTRTRTPARTLAYSFGVSVKLTSGSFVPTTQGYIISLEGLPTSSYAITRTW